jgi:hypothetical protein
MSKVLCCPVFYRYVSHSFIILSFIFFIIEIIIEIGAGAVNIFFAGEMRFRENSDRREKDKIKQDKRLVL